MLDFFPLSVCVKYYFLFLIVNKVSGNLLSLFSKWVCLLIGVIRAYNLVVYEVFEYLERF